MKDCLADVFRQRRPGLYDVREVGVTFDGFGQGAVNGALRIGATADSIRVACSTQEILVLFVQVRILAG
jgi:hypothetical protein